MSNLVIGGGLSGLSAAYYLAKTLPSQTTRLIESSQRLGGWIKTTKENNIIFEQAARTIRPRGEAGANTLDLIEELDLEDEIVPIFSDSPAAKNRMLYCDGELCMLPNSVRSLLRVQKPFTKPLLLHFVKDIVTKPKKVKDESIYDFTQRRFGTEVADYLISSMICGICAGNAKEISVNFLLKQLFEYEQQFGSITRGLYKNMFRGKANFKMGRLAQKAKQNKWNVYSFKNGMETLTRGLQKSIEGDVEIDLNTKCELIEFGKDQTEVVVHYNSGSSKTFSHIISAIPAQSLASLFHKEHESLRRMLENIKSVSVAVVNLHYQGNVLKNSAFGFLVPPTENLPILGVIFDSCCFHCGGDTVLTVMMGGYWFDKYFGSNPNSDTVLTTAVDQIKTTLGISDSPAYSKVNILKNCIPQYVVGHTENIQNIQDYIRKYNLPLSLCGASYYGVGVNDVILSGKNAVEKVQTLLYQDKNG